MRGTPADGDFAADGGRGGGGADSVRICDAGAVREGRDCPGRRPVRRRRLLLMRVVELS
ncbi:MAG: hypothetical protein OXC53_04905 [Rhodobacteraceae bacterium]|nr:hypothetical protein [Paracoccaceae bacterium]